MFYVRVEPMKSTIWHCNNKFNFQLQVFENQIRIKEDYRKEEKFELRLSLIN